MSFQRQMERRNKRVQVEQFRQLSKDEKYMSLIRNGITQKEVDEAYHDGMKEGYLTGSENTIMTIYAAVAKVLTEDGNTKDEVLGFLKAVDTIVVTSISGKEDIQALLDEYGIELIFKDELERVVSK